MLNQHSAYQTSYHQKPPETEFRRRNRVSHLAPQSPRFLRAAYLSKSPEDRARMNIVALFEVA